jgi:ADP-ribose pyrophosphatase
VRDSGLLHALLGLSGLDALMAHPVVGNSWEGFVIENTARQRARAGVLHPVIAYSTEVIEIWFAEELSLGERRLDTDEFLDVFTASPAELMAACQQGRLTDAKTLTGLLWLQNVQSGQWPLQWQTVS